MNKFTKIGLSALAGSLVAVSAQAGSMSVAGSASIAVEHVNGGAASTGKSWAMGNQLTFTGGGELDNGMNVSLSFVIDQGDDETDTSTQSGNPISTKKKNWPFVRLPAVRRKEICPAADPSRAAGCRVR